MAVLAYLRRNMVGFSARKCTGRPYLFYRWLMKPFSKPYLRVPAQIALLKARGLTITESGAATALERIG